MDRGPSTVTQERSESIDLELFDRYRKAEGAEKVRFRNKLVLESLDLAKKKTRAIFRSRTRSSQDLLEDLEQVAVIGLIQALDNFNPEKGPFGNWLKQRLLHVIAQEIRAAEPVLRHKETKMPWSVCQKDKVFYAKNGRKATAEELEVTEEQFEKWRTSESYVSVDVDCDATANLAAEPEDYDRARVLAFVNSMPELDRALLLGEKTFRELAAEYHLSFRDVQEKKEAALKLVAKRFGTATSKV